MSVQVERWTCTVDDYYRMAEAGILSRDDRVELINGEIIRMCPIGSTHAGCVIRLNMVLTGKVSGVALVSVQNPVRIDDYSEPQPDIALLRPRADYYVHSHAAPRDVFLLIEVAESSLAYDRSVKRALYARAGIPEFMVVCLPEDEAEAYSQPVDGEYQKMQTIKRGDIWCSESIPNLTLSAEEILG